MVLTLYATDFEYDGECLSDYGFIVCDFNASTDANIVSAGSQLNFNKVSKNQGKSFSLSSTQYKECISTTFDICKNPDVYDDLEITDDEFRELFRWLNRREFLSFRVIEDEKEDRYYEASFNVSKVKIREKLYGLELNMETNKPFAYGKKKSFLLDFTSSNESKELYDFSDEVGCISPLIEITCITAGDHIISNSTTGCRTTIRNCSVGEIITIDNENQIIKSSLRLDKDIANDFNYDFFKIENTYKNRANIISSQYPCKLQITYCPVIKDAP